MDAFELVHFECDNSVKILPNVTIKFFIGSEKNRGIKATSFYYFGPYMFLCTYILYLRLFTNVLGVENQ